MSITELINKTQSKISYFHSVLLCKFKKNNDFTWLSLGENCLSDDILQRHHRKSYSSVFSSGRSNIDYILDMENDNYENLLNKEHLYTATIGNEHVVRSNYYDKSSVHYHELHMNGFEFTHHNPLDKPEHVDAFKRRLTRMTSQKGKSNFIFLYHHRHCDNQNLLLLKEKLKIFQKFYSTGGKKCFIIFFYQSLVNENLRGLKLIGSTEGIYEFKIDTQHEWAGENQDVFWARVDDDLIGKMLNTSYNHIKSMI